MSIKAQTILDVRSDKISIMVGKRDVNNSILISTKIDEYYDGFNEGEFLEPKKLEKIVSSLVKEAQKDSNTKIKSIYVSVPTEFCYTLCKNVSQNFAKPKKITIRDVLSLFAMAYDFDKIKTHKLINQDYVYFVLGENNKVNNPIGQLEAKMTACLSSVLAEKYFLDIFDKIFNKLNIKQVKYVSSAYAQSLYLFDVEQRDRYALLVDCGYISTSVSLMRGRGLLNLSSFSLGGGNISADLSNCLKIPFSSAEKLNKKIVLCITPTDKDMYDTYVDGEVLPISMKVANAIVESRVEVIAKGIQKCFNSWNYNFPDFIPIYLTGCGLSHMKGARDLLGKILNKNVELVNLNYSSLNSIDYSSALAIMDFALNDN